MKTITISFNKNFENPDGTEMQPPQTQAELLSRVLVSGNKGDASKLWGWSQALAKNRPLALDCSDVEVLEGVVKTFPGGTNVLAVAQLLETITNAKLEHLRKPE